MSSGRISFAEWRERLDATEKECAWPGPRPLRTDDDPALLVARDAEKRGFVQEVRDRRMVFLTGPSGVGKTSLIRLGLEPELRAAQYEVGICRNWALSADATSPVEFLAEKVFDAFAEVLPADVSGADVFWTLDRMFPKTCVIVLDQFEELLRDSPQLRDSVFDLLAELNKRTDLKLVVSFRSEYLSDLKPLETQVNPFTMSHVALDQISDRFAFDVITAANRPGERPAIDELPDGASESEISCAHEIAELWQAAVRVNHAGGGRGERIGLLHLQATLYVLSFLAGKETTVGVEHLTAFKEDGPRDETPYALFSRALQRAVSLKIEHCQTAADGLDGWLLNGTTGTLAQIVRHLSSAGFKLIRGVGDLATAALESQLARLQPALTTGGEAVDMDLVIGTFVNLALTSEKSTDRIDLLTETIVGIAQKLDRSMARSDGPSAVRLTALLQRGAAPDVADPQGVTCGPMLGMAPANVLIEELRRFAFAVAWLNASDLARLSTPGEGTANLTLIHDGFGTALEKWSTRVRDEPAAVLASITAPSGGNFIWTEPADGERSSPLSGTREQPNIVLNQRWNGAWIQADLRWVTFVGCDLRGTAFGFCRFEGVTFVNCLLDGALISDSTIVGTAPDNITKDGQPFLLPEPEFVIRSSKTFTAALSRYRDAEIESTDLHIPLPGLPAEPVVSVDASLLELPESMGGLAIYGGRMSALTLRNLAIDNKVDGDGEDNRDEDEPSKKDVKAAVLMSNVAGSGIDVVEQDGGEFRIASSAVRHLTISPKLSSVSPEEDAPATPASRPLTLTIEATAVVQTWISSGITGRVTLRDCSVVQFWNDSPDVVAVAEDCSYYDLVGVDVTKSGPFGGKDSAVERAETGVNLASRFRRMTYRRNASVRDDLAN